MNKIVVIGWTGSMYCYLNITKEDAIKRYIEENGNITYGTNVREFYFNDEFGAYDIWGYEDEEESI